MIKIDIDINGDGDHYDNYIDYDDDDINDVYDGGDNDDDGDYGDDYMWIGRYQIRSSECFSAILKRSFLFQR